MVKRRSLIVYFKNENFLKNIDSSVNVAYVSKKRKYAVIYMETALNFTPYTVLGRFYEFCIAIIESLTFIKPCKPCISE